MQTQSVAVDERLCSERRERIEGVLDEHSEKLKDHEGRIGQLEQYKSKAEEQVNNLCNQIKALVKAMWWFIGVLITALLGFFIDFVQSIPRTP